MNKVYTIIEIFSVGDYNNFDECWVANYANREDAIKALDFKIRERFTELESEGFDENGKLTDPDGTKWTIPELFEYLASNGCCYETGVGSSIDRWFIRQENLQTTFSEDAIAI